MLNVPFKYPREPGSSIIELIAYLALSTIVFTLSIPAIRSARLNGALKKEVLILTHNLESMSLRALNESSDITILATSDSYQGSLNDKIIFFRRLPEQFTLSFSNQTGELSFYASGVASPVTITLSDGSQSCAVKVSLRSRISTVC